MKTKTAHVRTPKNKFFAPRTHHGRQAKTLTISLLPRHREHLKTRQNALDTQASRIFQKLLDLDQTQNLLTESTMAELQAREVENARNN